MSNTNRLVLLIEKFYKRPLTEAEKRKLDEGLAKVKDKDALYKKLLDDPSWILKDLRIMSQIDIDQGWKKVLAGVSASRSVKRMRNKYFPFTIAAAILSCCFTLLLIHTVSKKADHIPASPVGHTKTIANPRTVLVLHDGRSIVLDTCKNGFLCQQGNTRLSIDNGGIIFKVLPGITPHTEFLYNQIITYKEGPYQITLPDNSQVWLNAASSIKLPVAFNNEERNVEITGEAFFDVAHLNSGNRCRKFIVHVNSHIDRNMKVEVLGTRFNINAYDQQEDMKTTLLEGIIQISYANQDVLLAPGEQAQCYDNFIVVKNVTDTTQAIGWKEGYFQFSERSLKSILIEVARWHDLDVIFSGDEPENIKLSGAISHNESLEDIIKAMERTGKCKISLVRKRRLIVTF